MDYAGDLDQVERVTCLPRFSASTANRYDSMASLMLSSASSSVLPCDHHPADRDTRQHILRPLLKIDKILHSAPPFLTGTLPTFLPKGRDFEPDYSTN